MRCIFESLAARYGEVLGNLRGVAPFAIERLHVIGGGAQNDLLNQLTADACGIPVVAGPSEATAIGNVMVQARALGLVGSGSPGCATTSAARGRSGSFCRERNEF